MTRTITTGQARKEYTVDDAIAGRTQGTGQERRDVYVQTGDSRPIMFPALTAKQEQAVRKAAAGESFQWFVATGGPH